MNGGTLLAFLLTVVMVVVVVVHREPPLSGQEPATQTKPPVVVPAIPSPRPSTQFAAAPTPPGTPVVPTMRTVPPPAGSVLGDHEPTLKISGVGCAVAGATGTGLAVAAGPAEVTALLASVLFIPVSPIVIGAALGTVLATSCAVGAVVSPMLTSG